MGTGSLSGGVAALVLSAPPVGSYSVTATYPGDANLGASTSAPGTLVVNKAGQTIAFGSIAAQTVGNTVNLSATSTSGLAVSFASTTSPVCTVAGTTAKMLAAGTCTIQASQAGNANYSPAPSVTQSIKVTAATSSSFTITAVPGTETINRGVLGAFLLELKSVNGFNGNVTLGCSGGPAGSQCADLPQTVRVNGTALAISGILFPKNTKAGTYTLTFSGTSGSLKSSATATFIVK